MIFMIRESCLKFCIRASIARLLSCGALSALYPLANQGLYGLYCKLPNPNKSLTRHSTENCTLNDRQLAPPSQRASANHIRLLSLDRFQHLRANEKTLPMIEANSKPTKRYERLGISSSALARTANLPVTIKCTSLTQSRSESVPSEPDTSPHRLRTYR